jgi:hypothetical protein
VPSTKKNFLLNDGELERLGRLAEALYCSESDVIRWGMIALDGLLRDGLVTGSHRDDDGYPTSYSLVNHPRSEVMALKRKPDGSFALVSVSRRPLDGVFDDEEA